MPFQIIRNDITKVNCDAIVNAANESLLGGGGVDGAIHRAAGPQLLEECRTLGGCKTGKAKITKGYRLLCKYVIHTVGPVYRDGRHGEEELLRSCYRESLALADRYRCESVAFPLISAGAYGYPKDQALRVAVETIASFLADHDMVVSLVVLDSSAVQIDKTLFADLASYLDESFTEPHPSFPLSKRAEPGRQKRFAEVEMLSDSLTRRELPKLQKATSAPSESRSLADRVCQLDESFSEMLLRKIDESGMTDAECYKKANIDRKLFSKIRSDKQYQPSKQTAIAFAISLELSLAETKDLLMKAGFALSHSNKFDLIIEYFITRGVYDVFEINQALFAFDQSLLGM